MKFLHQNLSVNEIPYHAMYFTVTLLSMKTNNENSIRESLEFLSHNAMNDYEKKKQKKNEERNLRDTLISFIDQQNIRPKYTTIYHGTV